MPRLRFATAYEVLDAFPTARNDIGGDHVDAEPLAFLDGLTRKGLSVAALSFCAYLLPRREAVGWCCRGLRDLVGGRIKEETLVAAERWVRRPEDALRRNALALAMEGDLTLPTSWAALAAGWSGGSMSPGEHPVPAPPHLTARAVRAALLLAVSRQPAQRREANFAHLIGLGRRVATGEEEV